MLQGGQAAYQAGGGGGQQGAYQGCLVHGHLANQLQPTFLPSTLSLEREWQAKRRQLLQRNIQIPSSYYVARDPSLKEVARGPRKASLRSRSSVYG